MGGENESLLRRFSRPGGEERGEGLDWLLRLY